MTPYGMLSYFAFLLFPALPTMAAGLAGRLSRWLVLAASALMLVLQYGPTLEQDTARPLWMLLAYALYQGALVKAFELAKRRKLPAWTFTLAVILSLLPLAAVKLLPGAGLGFLGISYLTFRSLDVIFSLQDGLVKEVPLSDFWLFLLFFPTVASGPVDRYRRFMKDWERSRTRQEYLQDLDIAIHRIFRGLLYKFLIAYAIKRYWMDPVAAAQFPGATILYMYAYTFYLFFDFAGYSAFAVGVSHLFGVRTPENFDRPFLSQNIRDFWNRWHISLSTWLRDHVYMRFVMTATRRKWLADRQLISALGFALTMGLMGLWHGLQWHYIAYGLYHGALVIGYDLFSRWNKAHQFWGDGPIQRWVDIGLTFHAFSFGLLIFSGKLF